MDASLAYMSPLHDYIGFGPFERITIAVEKKRENKIHYFSR